jgi:hypothetical protein
MLQRLKAVESKLATLPALEEAVPDQVSSHAHTISSGAESTQLAHTSDNVVEAIGIQVHSKFTQGGMLQHASLAEEVVALRKRVSTLPVQHEILVAEVSEVCRQVGMLAETVAELQDSQRVARDCKSTQHESLHKLKPQVDTPQASTVAEKLGVSEALAAIVEQVEGLRSKVDVLAVSASGKAGSGDEEVAASSLVDIEQLKVHVARLQQARDLEPIQLTCSSKGEGVTREVTELADKLNAVIEQVAMLGASDTKISQAFDNVLGTVLQLQQSVTAAVEPPGRDRAEQLEPLSRDVADLALSVKDLHARSVEKSEFDALHKTVAALESGAATSSSMVVASSSQAEVDSVLEAVTTRIDSLVEDLAGLQIEVVAAAADSKEAAAVEQYTIVEIKDEICSIVAAVHALQKSSESLVTHGSAMDLAAISERLSTIELTLASAGKGLGSDVAALTQQIEMLHEVVASAKQDISVLRVDTDGNTAALHSIDAPLSYVTERFAALESGAPAGKVIGDDLAEPLEARGVANIELLSEQVCRLSAAVGRVGADTSIQAEALETVRSSMLKALAQKQDALDGVTLVPELFERRIAPRLELLGSEVTQALQDAGTAKELADVAHAGVLRIEAAFGDMCGASGVTMSAGAQLSERIMAVEEDLVGKSAELGALAERLEGLRTVTGDLHSRLEVTGASLDYSIAHDQEVLALSERVDMLCDVLDELRTDLGDTGCAKSQEEGAVRAERVLELELQVEGLTHAVTQLVNDSMNGEVAHVTSMGTSSTRQLEVRSHSCPISVSLSGSGCTEDAVHCKLTG